MEGEDRGRREREDRRGNEEEEREGMLTLVS